VEPSEVCIRAAVTGALQIAAWAAVASTVVAASAEVAASVVEEVAGFTVAVAAASVEVEAEADAVAAEEDAADSTKNQIVGKDYGARFKGAVFLVEGQRQ
jgi:hypothetical protein